MKTFQGRTGVELRENDVETVGKTRQGRAEGCWLHTERLAGDRQRDGCRRPSTPLYCQLDGGRHCQTAQESAGNALQDQKNRRVRRQQNQ